MNCTTVMLNVYGKGTTCPASVFHFLSFRREEVKRHSNEEN